MKVTWPGQGPRAQPELFDQGQALRSSYQCRLWCFARWLPKLLKSASIDVSIKFFSAQSLLFIAFSSAQTLFRPLGVFVFTKREYNYFNWWEICWRNYFLAIISDLLIFAFEPCLQLAFTNFVDSKINGFKHTYFHCDCRHLRHVNNLNPPNRHMFTKLVKMILDSRSVQLTLTSSTYYAWCDTYGREKSWQEYLYVNVCGMTADQHWFVY